MIFILFTKNICQIYGDNNNNHVVQEIEYIYMNCERKEKHMFNMISKTYLCIFIVKQNNIKYILIKWLYIYILLI